MTYERELIGYAIGSLFIFKMRKGAKYLFMEDFKVIDDYLCVKLPEEIDHHKSAYISENADRLILAEQVSNVVFDFEDTRFMDSSGIGVIMGRYRKISCFGGKVFAIHADRQIKRILTMSGLTRIIEIME